MAQLHVIGGICGGSCSADVAHGYRDLAHKQGGENADVCQPNLDNSLKVIIDDIVSRASPIVLDYSPISSTLAVAVESTSSLTVIPRDRALGFDYHASANTLVLNGIKYKKGTEIIAAYRRWYRSTPHK